MGTEQKLFILKYVRCVKIPKIHNLNKAVKDLDLSFERKKFPWKHFTENTNLECNFS